MMHKITILFLISNKKTTESDKTPFKWHYESANILLNSKITLERSKILHRPFIINNYDMLWNR